MKIQGLPPSVVTGTTNDKQAAEAKKDAPGQTGGTSAAAGDSVKISSAGVDMAKLENSVAQSEGIDRSKIEAIRDALQKGDYPFDADKIAEKMLGMEGLLNSK
ncbi:MAG: flagellar biosynthesis anti-sigma factor FlgM [Gammaproteobacteria bacterium SHHR-1]|uniref:flagellar biosynthesis anti-sigma factor FlgM n=1 Tax=Magnetovirga frankeli TaxID=947516 RepID=UPI0012938D1D|nr:flagellar biosynthesis anti-sigma factor FlgM [gamma proteobacterium SS-5]